MIKIDNVQTFGFEGAIRGMRNPYMSHEKSDSLEYCTGCRNCGYDDVYCYKCEYANRSSETCERPYDYTIGKADLELCKRLIKAGSEHRKFLRMIHVQCDVLAPRYWWAEMDKYKYVEANSSSTMHLITKRHFTEDDFSWYGFKCRFMDSLLNELNSLIDDYNRPTELYEGEKKDVFLAIKETLPESYNQLRTIDTNYECLLSIYHQRKNHRLSEWSGENGFCNWIYSLPYMSEFIGATEK